ncbi:MAG TPA: DUF1360 domain-containing protein [Mycobacteriales bacterium]|nr:DUF1360 domain-containing protein [Mycobacteriales bacterium]
MATEQLHEVKREYAGGEDRPLGSFLAVMATYAAVVGAGAAVVRARRIPMPESISWSDLALLTIATHKLSRRIAKDPVTSPLRAPFTRFEGTSGPAELSEEVRGRGVRKAVGELVTCPFCLDQWVATGLTFGYVVRPRLTRLAASVLTMVAGSDLLQFAYAKAEQAAEEG